MSFGHGKDAGFLITTVAGATVDISQYLTSVSFTQERDEVDVTCLGATYKNFIGGVQDASISVEGVWDPTLDGYLRALGTASGGSWAYGPQGTASGKTKFGGSAMRGAYNTPTDVGSAVTFTCDFHVQGAVTAGTF